MSAHIITQAAVKAWHNSLSGVSYSEWVHSAKQCGLYWLAADTIEEGV